MRLILLTALCAFALSTFIPFVSSKTIFDQSKDTGGEENKPHPINEHNDFFDSLTEEEKLWLMKISVLYAEEMMEVLPEYPSVELPEVPVPEEPEDPKKIKRTAYKAKGGFLPFPISDETPISLVAGLLNGKIPQDFQRGFTGWLRERYNLTQENFSHFQTYGTFCPPNVRDCPGFGDIGAECCPFG